MRSILPSRKQIITYKLLSWIKGMETESKKKAYRIMGLPISEIMSGLALLTASIFIIYSEEGLG